MYMAAHENHGRMEMKLILVCLLAAALSGCGMVEVQSPDGTRIVTRTLWKDIQTAEAQTEDMVLQLGSSTSADDARTMVAMCLLFPHLDGCGE